MNGLAAFAQKHQLTVRDISKICGGPGKLSGQRQNRTGGVSYPTVHRLIHRQIRQHYIDKIEPIIVSGLRRYLVSRGRTEAEAANEVPEKDFLAPLPQFTQEITVPNDCSANFIFKDQNGKLLSVVVFDHRA